MPQRLAFDGLAVFALFGCIAGGLLPAVSQGGPFGRSAAFPLAGFGRGAGCRRPIVIPGRHNILHHQRFAAPAAMASLRQARLGAGGRLARIHDCDMPQFKALGRTAAAAGFLRGASRCSPIMPQRLAFDGLAVFALLGCIASSLLPAVSQGGPFGCSAAFPLAGFGRGASSR